MRSRYFMSFFKRAAELLEPHPHRVVADAKGGGQFCQRGVGVLFDVRLKLGGIEFAPGSPACFGGQGVGFGGGKVAIDRALTQLEAPRGLGAGAAGLHELHHPLPQIQRVGFHAPNLSAILPISMLNAIGQQANPVAHGWNQPLPLF